MSLAQIIERKLPDIIGPTSEGQVFWAIVFSFAVVFPLSIARSLSALRFTSAFSFICGVFVVFSFVGVCLFNKAVNPDLGESL